MVKVSAFSPVMMSSKSATSATQTSTPINDSLMRLHTDLYARMQSHKLPLQAVVGCETVATRTRTHQAVISYLRPSNEAQTVEMMMGREMPLRRLELRHHPVIELREQPDGIVLELVIAPDAWWDQENFVGKLNLDRHRCDFRQLVSRLEGDFRLGFWHGTHLDATHVHASLAQHGAVFEMWLSTFCHRQDWLRVGMWYDAETLREFGDSLPQELFHRMTMLYSVYRFIGWTGRNDFRSFAQPQSSRMRFASA